MNKRDYRHFQEVDVRPDGKDLYHECLANDTLRAGMYVLAAGSSDPKSPHEEDEVYYVLSGTSKMELDRDVRVVQKGDLIYVPAHMPHRFTEIEVDLELLVFFSRMPVD